MTKPNLLFIVADEQRRDTLAAYGATRIHTPNLNRYIERPGAAGQAGLLTTAPTCRGNPQTRDVLAVAAGHGTWGQRHGAKERSTSNVSGTAIPG